MPMLLDATIPPDMITTAAVLLGMVGVLAGGVWQIAVATINAKEFRRTSEHLRDQLAVTATEFRDYLAKIEARLSAHEARLSAIEVSCRLRHQGVIAELRNRDVESGDGD